MQESALLKEGSPIGKAQENQANYCTLQKLLGKNITLIPCHWGTKLASIKWKQLGVEVMSDPNHLRRLESGNIAVKLGHASGGLCSIDIDDDNQFEAFLELNPSLKDSLITKGERGANIWVYIDGEYPPSKNTGPHSSWKIEWRAEGNYTIISGMHPKGCSYRFLNETPPLTVSLEDINWPEASGLAQKFVDHDRDLELPNVNQGNQCNQGSQGNHNNTYKPIGSLPSELKNELRHPSDKIHRIIPKVPKRNPDSLFNLARISVDIARRCHRNLTHKEHRQIHNIWLDLNQENLNPNQTHEDYYNEYIEAVKGVKYSETESALHVAALLAKEGKYPEGLANLPSGELTLLAGMCYNLQKINDNSGGFFLGLNDIIIHLFPQVTVMTASRRLNSLCSPHEVIERIKLGSQGSGKVSEFMWKGMPTNLENEAVPCHL